MSEMSTLDFLAKLEDLGIGLSVAGDRLRFDAPDGVMTPEVRCGLAARKVSLLKLLRNDSSKNAGAPSIFPKVERDGKLPLSFAQQRLWFLSQMKGASQSYHMPLVMRLRGALDCPALHRALDCILARHEALRTTISMSDGEPVQRIAPIEDNHFRLIEHDLRKEPDARAELDRLIELETSAPFDLNAGPLIRGRLVGIAQDEYILMITTHHISSDGWSVGLLMKELGLLYTSFLGGQEDPLPPLEVQYADYSVWQRKWLQGDPRRRQIDYWKVTLAGAPSLLEIPADHARPVEQDFAGSYETVVLDEGLTHALKQFSRRHRVTLFMTLLAGWATLLSRLSGQEDVMIGTPVANRRWKETQDLIGFFANTLVMRLDLAGSQSVKDLLMHTRKQVLDALQHQDIPFEQVVDLAHPVRSSSHPPLFQVMFAWQDSAQDHLELPGLDIETMEVPHHTAKFDLTLSLVDEGRTITGGIEYATSLFELPTIKRYIGYLLILLQGMVANDALAIDQLPMMPESERRQILVDWNDTDVAFPAEKCVHQLFEEQAAKTPDAVAVFSEDQQLTYSELNRRANRLAHFLRRKGVKPDARVAICFQRSFEMVVALLGVLKAGGAYVPLDPSYPPERLHFMLEDSSPHALLTQTQLLSKFAGFSEVLPILDLGLANPTWNVLPDTMPGPEEVGLSPDHLAYVIYTSGSTGRPKGVAMHHRSLVNLLSWQMSQPLFSRSARVLQFAALGFDVAFQEIASALCSGQTLVLTEEACRLNPGTLLNFIGRNEVQEVFLPYAMLSVLADRAGEIDNVLKDGRSLRHFPQEIITAGEQLRISHHIAALFQKLPHCRLQNQYGPTETHVVTSFSLPPDVAQWNTLPPIGRPIANSRIYILDKCGEPVPPGVVGELYAGGTCVARGYLNRPELTAERFLPDPFNSDPKARMYRTGDLARWMPDGTIEYVGRNDFQVKIRGFRVELGEIESRLTEHPGVSESVVVAREDASDDKRLVAYYTTSSKIQSELDTVTAEELRAHLLASLPEYMVPAAYVHLKCLPFTPNGKLDRLALPAPEVNSFFTRVYNPPLGDLEAKLADIWAELLAVDRVGRDDNFFDLGGHSLLATRLVTRIRKSLGVDLPLRRVFADPTIVGLATYIEAVDCSSPAAPVLLGEALEEGEL